MKFSIAAVTALLSTAAIAAPAFDIEERSSEAVSMMAAGTPEWTIVNMKRTCNAADTSCTWNFGINQNNGIPQQACKLVINQADASQAKNSGVQTCGAYSVSSGWSGQFGAGHGFTTFAVVYNPKKLITYPAYSDSQIKNGVVVQPNQSYAPQTVG